jgi:hypothetical protein
MRACPVSSSTPRLHATLAGCGEFTLHSALHPHAALATLAASPLAPLSPSARIRSQTTQRPVHAETQGRGPARVTLRAGRDATNLRPCVWSSPVVRADARLSVHRRALEPPAVRRPALHRRAIRRPVVHRPAAYRFGPRRPRRRLRFRRAAAARRRAGPRVGGGVGGRLRVAWAVCARLTRPSRPAHPGPRRVRPAQARGHVVPPAARRSSSRRLVPSLPAHGLTSSPIQPARALQSSRPGPS